VRQFRAKARESKNPLNPGSCGMISGDEQLTHFILATCAERKPELDQIREFVLVGRIKRRRLPTEHLAVVARSG